jgi:hypothetical protein
LERSWCCGSAAEALKESDQRIDQALQEVAEHLTQVDPIEETRHRAEQVAQQVPWSWQCGDV